MAKREVEFHRPAGTWVRASKVVLGIWAQVLAEDVASQVYSGLQRYEPGVGTTPLGVQVHNC